MTTDTANNLKICYRIIIVPQCTHLQYKPRSPFSSQGKKKSEKVKTMLRKRRKRGKIWSCIHEAHVIAFKALTW